MDVSPQPTRSSLTQLRHGRSRLSERKALFVPSLKRDIVPLLRAHDLRREVAWQSTSDGGNSFYRSHSTNIFLNHAQMDSETLQIDFEWACNLK
jgi:hypothetical protein